MSLLNGTEIDFNEEMTDKFFYTPQAVVNEAANDSVRVSGQDRKILPALGTNQIAGFGGFRPLASLEKNKSSYGCTPEVWTAQEKRKSCSRRSLEQLAS